MDSQLFYYINLVVALIFLAWFWTARRNRGAKPTQLNLRNPETPVEGKKQDDAVVRRKDESAVQKAKPLNILFIYNGHDWDAYEVLGVPAGAGLPLVTERYQNLVRESDEGQRQFYEAAFQAILKKL